MGKFMPNNFYTALSPPRAIFQEGQQQLKETKGVLRQVGSGCRSPFRKNRIILPANGGPAWPQRGSYRPSPLPLNAFRRFCHWYYPPCCPLCKIASCFERQGNAPSPALCAFGRMGGTLQVCRCAAEPNIPKQNLAFAYNTKAAPLHGSSVQRGCFFWFTFRQAALR